MTHQIIRHYRKKAGLTLQQVADIMNTRPSTISRWETGLRRLPAERTAELARIIGCSRHDLRPDIFEREAA